MKALSGWMTVGITPESLGISHFPGSPGTAGALKRARAVWSTAAVGVQVPAVAGAGGGTEGGVGDAGKAGGAAIVAESDRDIEEGVPNLLVADVEVLVGNKAEELVLNDGATDSAAGDIAMELGFFMLAGTSAS
jgi:hypothetical protein